jgi:geranylgeranyl reductase family protein
MEMTLQDHYDVIIVGGGPAGSACATLLAREGLHALLVEKARFPREKICGECVNPRCWRFFELLGVADELRSLKLNRIETFRVTTSGGPTVGGQIPAHPDRPFFSLARSVLDSVLLNRARATGAEVMEGTAAIDVQQDKTWHVVVRDLDSGALSSLRSNFLVGADGRNSLVARKISDFSQSVNGERSRTSLKDQRVGVQWHAAHQPQIGSAVEMFLFASGYGGMVNIDNSRANVALVTRPELARFAQLSFPRFLAETIFSDPTARQRLELLDPVGEIHAAFPITPSTHQSCHRHAFLIGDARQTVEPFTGEGIFFALQDGFAAAASILNTTHPDESFVGVRTSRLPMVPNFLVSPILQSPRISDFVVRLGSKFPHVAVQTAHWLLR